DVPLRHDPRRNQADLAMKLRTLLLVAAALVAPAVTPLVAPLHAQAGAAQAQTDSATRALNAEANRSLTGSPHGEAAGAHGSSEGGGDIIMPHITDAHHVEVPVLYIRDEVILANVGPHGEGFAPYLLTVFFFLLFANMLGLIPYGSTATGNIGVTLTLAIISFLVIELAGMRALGKGYLGT